MARGSCDFVAGALALGVLTLPGRYPAWVPPARAHERRTPRRGAPGRGRRPVRTPGRQISSVTCAGRPLSRVLRSPRAGRTATADGLGLGLMISAAGPPSQIAPRLWSLAHRPHSCDTTFFCRGCANSDMWSGQRGAHATVGAVVTAETMAGLRRLWSTCQRPHSFVVSVPTTTNGHAGQSETVHSQMTRRRAESSEVAAEEPGQLQRTDHGDGNHDGSHNHHVQVGGPSQRAQKGHRQKTASGNYGTPDYPGHLTIIRRPFDAACVQHQSVTAWAIAGRAAPAIRPRLPVPRSGRGSWPGRPGCSGPSWW